jgi:hypothetical protein
MNRLIFIFFAFILSNCKGTNKKIHGVTGGLTSIERIRTECAVATISFYKDLGSTPLVLKPAIEKSYLDTIFSLIGKNSTDTG